MNDILQRWYVMAVLNFNYSRPTWHFYSGIRRLPAVCACGKTLEELGLEMYEVTHCDPLHDFKNVIVHLLEELPFQINDPDIKKEIRHFCSSSMGMCRLCVKFSFHITTVPET